MNFKRIFACVALGLAASQVGIMAAGQVHQAADGSYHIDSTLLHDCQEYLRARANPRPLTETLTKLEREDAMECVNFVSAVEQAWVFIEYSSCKREAMPGKGSAITLVVNYMHKHPMDPCIPDAVPIVSALREAYPCLDAKKISDKPK